MTVRRHNAARAARAVPSTPSQVGPAGRPNRGVNTLFLVLAAVGSLHAVTMLGVEAWRSFAGAQEVTRLEQNISDLHYEIDGLQAVVNHAADNTYREQLARCLGFIYPDEARYITLLEPGSEPTLSGPLCQ
ncbi:hypothetical protein BH24DEI2_BH24DEI2_04460 [soil metagenome]